jgi:hypothetical protein
MRSRVSCHHDITDHKIGGSLALINHLGETKILKDHTYSNDERVVLFFQVPTTLAEPCFSLLVFAVCIAATATTWPDVLSSALWKELPRESEDHRWCGSIHWYDLYGRGMRPWVVVVQTTETAKDRSLIFPWNQIMCWTGGCDRVRGRAPSAVPNRRCGNSVTFRYCSCLSGWTWEDGGICAACLPAFLSSNVRYCVAESYRSVHLPFSEKLHDGLVVSPKACVSDAGYSLDC